jgi:hypothetical protein
MERASLFALALASASGIAHATGGGGLGVYPDGLENFMSGALPPPGVYGIAYAGSLRYDAVRDGAGKRVEPPDFGVRVNLDQLHRRGPAQVNAGLEKGGLARAAVSGPRTSQGGAG